jgi:hypothetical protein
MMAGGKAARDKGARGELRVCHFLTDLGFTAKRVSSEETGTFGGHCGWDVEARATEKGIPWAIQVKEVGTNAPSLASMMGDAAVSLAFVHFTGGKLRGRSFVIVDAKDLTLLAEDVMRAIQTVSQDPA